MANRIYFGQYPARYLIQVLGRLTWIFGFAGLLTIGALAAVAANAYLFYEERRAIYAVFTAVAIVFTGFFLPILVAGIRDAFHARIVLYFDRRVGVSELFTGGPELARNCRRLDDLAIACHVRPPSDFGFFDNYYMPARKMEWRAAQEGLQTITALLTAAEQDSALCDREKLTSELRAIEAALEKADAAGAKFRFILRQGKDEMIVPNEYKRPGGSFA